MEIYKGILCISGTELTAPSENSGGGGKLLSISHLQNLVSEKKVNRLRRASKGCSALYEYASLPLRIRRAWEELHGDPTKQPIKTKVIDFIHYDDKARSFYSEMVLPSGDTLTASDVQKYTLNASVLGGVREYISSKLAARSFSGRKTTKKELWSAISSSIDDGEFRKAWEHTLPTFPAKLRAKYEKFIADGYASLVHLGFGNNNSRKVTQQIERLLWALYTMPNKPFGLETHDYYKMFMCGAIAVYDKQSGELFDRDAFIRQGAPMELSAATVHNYLNQARARAAVDKRRNDSLWYSDHHMPYVHRKRPQFSLSRLSADDRDLPRKDRSGVAPLAYYIYDIASTAVVGVAYSRKKDKALFLECFRDMFRTLVRKGLPMPAEIELEHHLASDFRDEMSTMFPFVRWCRPGNAREKYAEPMNRSKKMTVEHRNHPNVGRWWARGEWYTQRSAKVDNQYVEKLYDYSQLVQEDRMDILEYNMAPHPNQKKYRGMTRWQVLLEQFNPNLENVNRALVTYCIGDKIRTSVRANQFVMAACREFVLPSPEILGRLEPGNYKVDAYCLPEEDGTVNEVFLYQGSRFLCRCEPLEAYQTATVEQTDRDLEIREQQFRYIEAFKSQVKNDLADVPHVGILKHDDLRAVDEVQDVEEVSIPTAADDLAPFDVDTEIDFDAVRRQAKKNLSKTQQKYGTAS